MNDIYQELALLYLKNQDIKSLSPAELFAKYREVLQEIQQEARNKNITNLCINNSLLTATIASEISFRSSGNGFFESSASCSNCL